MALRQQLHTFACLVAIPLLAGCGGAPSYRLQLERPQKDALHAEIRLPHRLSPAAYRAIAEREMAALHATLDREDQPLYEVEFQFIVPRQDGQQELRAATYTWRVPSLEDTSSEPHAAALVLY